MNYHHLSIEERSCIRKYYVDGLSYREIARLVGRNASTVSREIRRNCTHMYDILTYYPHTAQKSICYGAKGRAMGARKRVENTVRASRSTNGTDPCTAEKRPGTEKRIRW
ncbi:helix-turn-helix domain-containing protein [Flavonifractor sp. An10]|uniref:helix-turn-helix domain-containing protein n=1 Tax=Flavonifractor sp. An10 TaxID=1965537 RepID=UPI001FA873F9|nr:helix-turn-helix domain-containing protein [Flavonifractor sp. An10]